MPFDTDICIIAGELSGDQHAAALVAALKQVLPGATFWGTGGEHMRAAGVDTLYDCDDLAVMGVSEVLRRFGFFRAMFKHLCRELEQRQPDVVVLVDYPGFNLRFAEQAHERAIRTVFYISPQVWAWKQSRIPKMARILDHLITIFPFEAPYFEGTGLPTTYVGHPLVEALQPYANRGETQRRNRIALLPGSRVHEIRRILPTLLDACAQLAARRQDLEFVIACPNTDLEKRMRTQFPKLSELPITIETGRTHAILTEARAAWVASGTATVETALLRCPMVITYRVAPFTYAVARRIVKVEHIGMVNIIAGRRLCPELVQHDATPQNLVDALLPLIDDSPARRAMLSGFDEVAQALGEPGAAARAARVVAQILGA